MILLIFAQDSGPCVTRYSSSWRSRSYKRYQILWSTIWLWVCLRDCAWCIVKLRIPDIDIKAKGGTSTCDNPGGREASDSHSVFLMPHGPHIWSVLPTLDITSKCYPSLSSFQAEWHLKMECLNGTYHACALILTSFPSSDWLGMWVPELFCFLSDNYSVLGDSVAWDRPEAASYPCGQKLNNQGALPHVPFQCPFYSQMLLDPCHSEMFVSAVRHKSEYRYHRSNILGDILQMVKWLGWRAYFSLFSHCRGWVGDWESCYMKRCLVVEQSSVSGKDSRRQGKKKKHRIKLNK